MARPATLDEFPESNLVLKAPPGQEDVVLDLLAHRHGNMLISRWELTDEERAAVAAGGPVWLSVWTMGGPPPVAVMGLSPFYQGAAPPVPQTPATEGPTPEQVAAYLKTLEPPTGA